MQLTVPTLEYGGVTARPLRLRDARALERELRINRHWLQQWEATNPGDGPVIDARATIRSLQQYARSGSGLPFVIEVDGELVGQVNVSGITYGSIGSAAVGYWISERQAGRNIIPTAVALAVDYCFTRTGLHRIEICIRPENTASLRVVQKLGFRYEGLRRRYIHIDGDWRDHFCFALVSEEIPEGVLHRWMNGYVPTQNGIPTEADRTLANTSLQRNHYR